jgi:hypothetical protein
LIIVVSVGFTIASVVGFSGEIEWLSVLTLFSELGIELVVFSEVGLTIITELVSIVGVSVFGKSLFFSVPESVGILDFSEREESVGLCVISEKEVSGRSVLVFNKSEFKESFRLSEGLYFDVSLGLSITSELDVSKTLLEGIMSELGNSVGLLDRRSDDEPSEEISVGRELVNSVGALDIFELSISVESSDGKELDKSLTLFDKYELSISNEL